MQNQNTSKPLSTRARRAGHIGWFGVIVGVLGMLMMLLSGPSYRLGLLGLGNAFGMMSMGAKAGMVAALIGLIALVWSLVARSTRLSLRAVLAIALGVLAFGPPLLFAKKAGSVPPIHDISTDTANPPAFQALLAARAKAPNSAVYGGTKVADQQHAAYPDIQPIQLSATPAKVFEAAVQTAHDMGWKIAASDPTSGRIEATATTFWFGFKDDVVIRIAADASGSRLDIRSESRIGGSDVGKNAERIRRFRSKLLARLGSSGG